MTKYRIKTDLEFVVIGVVERWCPGCGMTLLQDANQVEKPMSEAVVAVSGHGFRMGDSLQCETGMLEEYLNSRMFVIGWN